MEAQDGPAQDHRQLQLLNVQFLITFDTTDNPFLKQVINMSCIHDVCSSLFSNQMTIFGILQGNHRPFLQCVDLLPM
jgi:hypothetical protein